MTTIKARMFSERIDQATHQVASVKWENGLFFCIALLFSQAVVFEAVAPFFLSFWLVVQQRYKSYQLATVVGGLIGTCYLSLGQAAIMCGTLLLLSGLLKIRLLQNRPISCLLMSMIFVQAVWQVIFYSGLPPVLVQMYILYELFFGVVAFIFMRQFFLAHHEFTTKWTTERVIAGCIVLALLVIGMQNMTIFYFSFAVLFLHAVICFAALAGGLPASLLVAVVVGMLSGVAQLSFTGMLALYAVTGVTVGLMQPAGRLAVVVSSIVPSVFFFLYDATLPLDAVYFVSVISAGLLVLLLPKNFIGQMKQRYIVQTATPEVAATAMDNQIEAFQQFVYFLKELVTEQFTLATPATQKAAPLSACAGCFRYEHCWKNGAIKEPVEQWIAAKTLQKSFNIVRVEEQLKGKCIKPQKLLEQLHESVYEAQMSGRFYHGKKMLALQLADLSEHLQSLLENQQTVNKQGQEIALIQFLEEHHISCTYARFHKDEAGERMLVCRIIGQVAVAEVGELVTAFFEEPFVGQVNAQQEPSSFTEQHFYSAPCYQLAYDIYKRTEQTSIVSGDSHSVFTLQPGLEVIMLSDGMGTSYRAQRESARLIQMMQDCLSYDMNPETALHTVHYILSLKNDSDLYATLDFALVDLRRGELWCWKAGGMTTYILRGSDMIKLESSAAPIGFMMNLTIETEHHLLRDDDYIIIVSDGLFSTQENWQRQEQLFLQFIRHSIKKHTQLSTMLYETMAQYEERFTIEDDCTVMLFGIKQQTKQWSVYKPEQLQKG